MISGQNEGLGTKPIKRLLWDLGAPATVGLLVNALYNIIDSIFIGQGVGSLGIGGLTAAFPIQNIIMAFAQMIGMGSASAVSRALGAKQDERATRFVGHAMVLSFGFGLALALLGLLLMEPILQTVGASGQVLPYAKEYMQVIYLGTAFHSFAVCVNPLIRAEGQAQVAMRAMVLGTGLNIVLNPLFIFTLDMGIRGAAIATVLSQGAAFLYSLRYLLSPQSSYQPRLEDFKVRWSELREILTVGAPSFARLSASSLLHGSANNIVQVYGGAAALASYGILMRLMIFLVMPVFGVVQGFQAIVGYNYGAKRFDRVQESIWLSIRYTTMILCVGTLVSLLFARPLVGLFTTAEEVLAISVPAVRLSNLALPIIGVQIITATVYQSLGFAKGALLLSLLRQIILLLPMMMLLPPLGLGLTGIWMAIPLSDLLSTVISAWLLRGQLRNFKAQT